MDQFDSFEKHIEDTLIAGAGLCKKSAVEVIVKEGQVLVADQPLTNNPNVGGFGQKDGEIVLQNTSRVLGLLGFFVFILLAQILLVVKKKQFEKVQLAEMNF